MASRFKGTAAFPRGFEPTFHPDRIVEPYRLKIPSKIFTCSMGELFGGWIPESWIGSILFTISNNRRHTFQVLTKSPENLYKWNKFFPENLWVGVSVTCQEDVSRIFHLRMQSVKVKVVSFEPLLGPIKAKLRNVDWIIIGGQTRPTRISEKCWVQSLVDQARELGIPVFLKDNLYWPEKIQQFPRITAKELCRATNR